MTRRKERRKKRRMKKGEPEQRENQVDTHFQSNTQITRAITDKCRAKKQ